MMGQCMPVKKKREFQKQSFRLHTFGIAIVEDYVLPVSGGMMNALS